VCFHQDFISKSGKTECVFFKENSTFSSFSLTYLIATHDAKCPMQKIMTSWSKYVNLYPDSSSHYHCLGLKTQQFSLFCPEIRSTGPKDYFVVVVVVVVVVSRR
jgi:hypothetical protein